VLVDGRGVPLAAAVDGANVHDQKLLVPTLDGIPVERPEPEPHKPQHLCLDKGYVGEPVEREVRQRGYILHLPVKGDERATRHHRHGKARRWKVERTHSWVNRSRRLLIRWEKKVANYFGFLHLQFAIVALRTAGVLG
jgi:putative transposase